MCSDIPPLHAAPDIKASKPLLAPSLAGHGLSVLLRTIRRSNNDVDSVLRFISILRSSPQTLRMHDRFHRHGRVRLAKMRLLQDPSVLTRTNAFRVRTLRERRPSGPCRRSSAEQTAPPGRQGPHAWESVYRPRPRAVRLHACVGPLGTGANASDFRWQRGQSPRLGLNTFRGRVPPQGS